MNYMYRYEKSIKKSFLLFVKVISVIYHVLLGDLHCMAQE